MPPFASNPGQTITKALTLRLDPNDDEAERKERMGVERRTELEVRRELTRIVGDLYPPGSEPANAFTEAVRASEAVTGERMRDILSRALQDSADLGVSVAVRKLEGVGYGFDYTLANESARAWALRYTDDVLAQLGTTTSRIVGQAVGRWVGNGEPLQSLVRDLQPAFGKQRARLIASTEVTRAYAEGSKEAFVESGVVTKLVWQASMDERVCIYCGSLHGKTVGIEESFDGKLPADLRAKVRPFAVPPAHPGCRCWLSPQVEEVARPKPKPKPKPVAPPPVAIPKPAPAPVVAPPVIINPVPQVEATTDAYQYLPSRKQLDRVESQVDRYVKKVALEQRVSVAQVEAKAREAITKIATQHDMAIQFKSENLDRFLSDPRLKSQFETGRSGGALDHNLRADAEYAGLGAPLDLDPKRRPIYGYMNLGENAQKRVSQYGDITFVLKDTVRERSTITVGDSLYNMRTGYVAGTPVTQPEKASWDTRVDALYDYAKFGDTTTLLNRIGYAEIQIQNGVGIGDVRAVIDRTGALTQAHRQRLKDLGVEVWDK